MNPQYMPQSQYGAPPQGFPPMKQGPGIPQSNLQDSFPMNSNQSSQQSGGYMQPPSHQYPGYKGPMGPQNSPMPPLNQMQPNTGTMMGPPPVSAPSSVPQPMSNRPPVGPPSQQNSFNNNLPPPPPQQQHHSDPMQNGQSSPQRQQQQPQMAHQPPVSTNSVPLSQLPPGPLPPSSTNNNSNIQQMSPPKRQMSPLPPPGQGPPPTMPDQMSAPQSQPMHQMGPSSGLPPPPQQQQQQPQQPILPPPTSSMGQPYLAVCPPHPSALQQQPGLPPTSGSISGPPTSNMPPLPRPGAGQINYSQQQQQQQQQPPPPLLQQPGGPQMPPQSQPPATKMMQPPGPPGLMGNISYPGLIRPPSSSMQPPPGNNPYGTGQLTNAMTDMHISGSGNRQYPMPPSMKQQQQPPPPMMMSNGDGSQMMPPPPSSSSSHMMQPPPIQQQQHQQPPPPLMNQGLYMNGAQNRGLQQPGLLPPPPSMGGYSQHQQPLMPPLPPTHMQQQPPMPSGPYPAQSQYQQQQQQQQQQARRLDPDQMPSPIQVMLDDQKTRSGIFCTNQRGLVPPLVSTNFITQDQGNAGPRFIRSTMYNVPTTSDMMKQTAVPFGLVISPLARTLEQEYQPPIVDFGELGPVRCIRCKAYISPFMQFIDSGRRFQCLFCKATTEVPAEYFQHLDHTGQRVDRYERPELLLGAYEFVATKDYCRNNVHPKVPAVIFLIDVSYNNMKSGLVHLLCGQMKQILRYLPIDNGQEKSRMKVGFITYNSTVHFYNIKGTLAQPQMLVVGDTNEMFMPLLDGFLCDYEESETVIDSLMAQIPQMFSDTRETETILLPAIQAGLEALKASECAGKLFVFHSSLPIADAPGRLKNRDERKLLGTEKERTVLVPQIQSYNQLGQECVQAGCSVDLFITNNSYIDLATIGQVARLTGGEIFKYTYFQADVDGERLIQDVITDISRPIVFDSIMRVRTSTGVRPTDFYGHFFMSNTTDMEIAAIDCDKAIAIEIKHDDKLTEEEGVYIQVALLYTSCAGQRRLRILNLSLKTCSQMADLYRSCELDTIVNFFAKQSVYKLLENNPKVVKDALVNRCAQMLACYRRNCASPSSAGQLILPECMKLLPLYVNCLLKSDAVSGGSDMTLDDRSFVMQCVTTMDIPCSVAYFYPRLLPLHEIQNGTETPEVPNAIRCTIDKMTDNGVYLLENGIHMLLWIGLNANQDWIQSVFGAPSAAQVDIDRVSLPELDNSLNKAVRHLIEQIRIQRHRCMRLTFVRQRDKLETVFRHFLMEDRGQDGNSSYVDFLCHMHKEIRQLLS